MKRSLVVLGCCLLVAAVMTGFSCTASPKLAPTSYKLPSLIGITTSGVGGAGHSTAVAYSPVMEKYLGVKVRVLPSNSATVNFSQIKDRKAYFQGGGVSQVGYSQANEGVSDFIAPEWGPQRMAFVWGSMESPYGIGVRADSDIKTIADIKGKRYGWYSGSTAWSTRAEAFLAFAGLSLNDVRVVDLGSYAAVARGLVEGKIDAATMGSVATVNYEIEEKGIRWLPLPPEDKEGWKRLHTVDPWEGGAVSQSGVPSSHGVYLLDAGMIIGTYEAMDEELIYQVARFFGEAWDEYKAIDKRLLDYSLEKTVKFIKDRRIAVPIHQGTIRYLKEKGAWTAEDDAWNKKYLGYFDMYDRAWDNALAAASEKKIEPSLQNKAWLELWNSYHKQLPSFSAGG